MFKYDVDYLQRVHFHSVYVSRRQFLYSTFLYKLLKYNFFYVCVICHCVLKLLKFSQQSDVLVNCVSQSIGYILMCDKMKFSLLLSLNPTGTLFEKHK